MSHWIMGVFVAFVGFVGLFMAAAARDFAILAFGLGLALFAVLFCGWMIRTAFDAAEERDG